MLEKTKPYNTEVDNKINVNNIYHRLLLVLTYNKCDV